MTSTNQQQSNRALVRVALNHGGSGGEKPGILLTDRRHTYPEHAREQRLLGFAPRLLVWVLACLATTGCVRRRLTIRSNPPGAVAFVDDQRIGITPTSTPYTYYGTRELRLMKDGYESLTVKQRFQPPWYQYPGLDFISENLWPGEVRDERVVEFEMVPQLVVPNDQLIERAELLRSNTASGHSVPLVPSTATPNFIPEAPPGVLPPPEIGS